MQRIKEPFLSKTMSNILRHWSKPVLSCVNTQLQQVHNVRNFGIFHSLKFTIIPKTLETSRVPSISQTSSLLRPDLIPSLVIQPSAGIKHVAKPQKRCRHCYFQIKDEQRFVMCTANPRHYTAQKMPGKKQKTWVFTGATTGSSSRGRGHGSRHMKTQLSFRLDY